MIIFLLSYFTVYTLAHYYLLHKAGKAGLPVFRDFGLRWRATVPLAALVLFLVAAPILIRIMERAGLEAAPRLLAYGSYGWMGLLFLFIALAVVTDLLLPVIRLISRLTGKGRGTAGTQKIFLIQILLVAGIFCYGFHEARTIKTEHLIVRSPAIPAGGTRLVQISDVHLGLLVGERRLHNIIHKVREAEPDLLIATGDLVDGQPDSLKGIGRMLAALQPPLGKLAVTGNHEFYAGLDKSLGFTRAAGFRILRNRSIVRGGISFTGLDDQTAERFGQPEIPDAATLLRQQPPDHFRILLKHRPEASPESTGFFDLQLSGHTHKGQIFPFSLVTRLFYPRPTGLSRIEQGGFLYHSRGTGTWGPPIRVLSPPEVTVIDLRPGRETAIRVVEQ